MARFGKPPYLFKIDISSKKYQSFFKYYQEADIKKMIYLYFDVNSKSDQAIFFNSRIRLRVRLKGGEYSLELKCKKFECTCSHKCEFIQIITFDELNLLFQGIIPQGIVRDKLREFKLLQNVVFIKTAFTTRSKRVFHDGVLVLDETIGNCQFNYQVEFRTWKQVSARELRTIKKSLGLSGYGQFKSKLKRIWSK